MSVQDAVKAGGASWSIEDIPYGMLVPQRQQAVGDATGDDRLFYLVASASFIEITSHLYSHNLVDYFRGDAEVTGWLEREWEPEEMQHGAALKRYVEIAWPDFDWDAAYTTFLELYTPLCKPERLAGTRTLEMAARCVVETGTASFYRTLASLSAGEPVLARLAASISADEVRHYKHFYAYFLRYRDIDKTSRTAVARALWSRLIDVEAEDAFCAYKALFLARHPGADPTKGDYEEYRAGVLQLMKDHLPEEMTAKMLLKPLGLHALISKAMLPVLTSATHFFLFR
jgi:hypothetical protein